MIRAMTVRFEVHPVTPQERLLNKAAEQLAAGGLGLCPTDAGYTLVWAIASREAEERVRRLRQLDSKHPFTLLCRQLSEAGRLARLDDPAFRLLRSLTPGPCTFILPASAELPKRIRDGGRSKRRDIGIRLPDHVVTRALLEAMGEPLLSASLVLPDEGDLVSHEAESVAEASLRWVDFMLDAGDCPPGPTSMVDCTGDEPEVLRQGFQPVDLQRPARRK
jgi:tRNA threonylcarbamoyl adenosine modification protein (Sua5/YciO/YrdC/YwlC family)